MPDNDQPKDDLVEELADPPEEFWSAIPEVEPSPEARAREAVQEQLEEAAAARRGAFLNVNVSRNKGIVAQLAALTGQVSRLATAVERLLEEAYGVRSQEGEMRGEEPVVDYTDQDKYDINEALEAAKNLEEEGDHD